MTDNIEFLPSAKPQPGEITPQSRDANRFTEGQPIAHDDPETNPSLVVKEPLVSEVKVINLDERRDRRPQNTSSA